VDAADDDRPAEGPSPYGQVGGEQGVRRLVDRFYDLMDLEPSYAALRALHPSDLSGSRDKLFWFLSGWLGGPSLYAERIGHPMLRFRHLPYAIGIAERDQWVACMASAMQDLGPDAGLTTDLQDRLLRAFAGTADWMRNR